MIGHLTAERDRLVAWRKANLSAIGGVEFRKATLAERLLTDLIKFNGGTQEQRVFVARRLAEIEAGVGLDL